MKVPHRCSLDRPVLRRPLRTPPTDFGSLQCASLLPSMIDCSPIICEEERSLPVGTEMGRPGYIFESGCQKDGKDVPSPARARVMVPRRSKRARCHAYELIRQTVRHVLVHVLVNMSRRDLSHQFSETPGLPRAQPHLRTSTYEANAQHDSKIG